MNQSSGVFFQFILVGEVLWRKCWVINRHRLFDVAVVHPLCGMDQSPGEAGENHSKSIVSHFYQLIEGSLEVKLPTIWTDEKQRWEESEKRREEKKKGNQRRESQKKEDAGARKVKKVAKHCVFPMICGSGGSISRLAKAAGAGPAGQMRDEQLHAVVARSTFRSQNLQNTKASETTFGSWHVEKVHAVAARSTFRSQQCKKLTGSEHFLTFRCRCAWQAQGILHVAKSEQNERFCSIFSYNHHYTTLQLQLQLDLHYIPLHYTALHYTALRYTALHYTALHYTALHYTALHYTALHYTALHYTLHNTTHYTTLYCTTLH